MVNPEIVDARECVIATLTRLAPINIAVIVAAPATNPNVLGQLSARQTVIYAVRVVSARPDLLNPISCLPELRQDSTNEIYIYVLWHVPRCNNTNKTLLLRPSETHTVIIITRSSQAPRVTSPHEVLAPVSS